MRTTVLLSVIIALLVAFLGYELWKDGRLPFVPGPGAEVATAAEAPVAPAAAEPAAPVEPAPPPPPRTIVMQCEGTEHGEGYGMTEQTGEHFFTIRFQPGGDSFIASGSIGGPPVSRGRNDATITASEVRWNAEYSINVGNYSSTARLVLNRETGQYSGSMPWAPLGGDFRKSWRGYCRNAGAE